MPRMEVSTSMQLSDVQTDNYWRDRYRHDGIRDKKWQEKPKKRRSSSFKVMPVAPQLRPVEKSTSQSQLAVGGRRSSYEWSVPAKPNRKAQSLPNLLVPPPPLKQNKRQYLAPQQGGRYSLSPIPSRPTSSMNQTSPKYLVPEVCSTNPSPFTSPSSTRKASLTSARMQDKSPRMGSMGAGVGLSRDGGSKSPGQAKRTFVSDMSSIGRNSRRSPFRR
ncbi:hypothetical protein PTSG_11824 [Salpingoeca rosetta]|uniref:Uncharacterized protein n=1 Tax=Salpingoeca rosetta (strain ATCC 50818 / BSB-021) TaxID=946362 RepID=F2TZM7_SALR5|nr:uncharacterized protein PTSG_11824 [Salpingoeca rosetta]EGD79051.1 hypothetical protein PTSG_11824 [Salpingoeca rosetta]|eukprot:XP_004998007.1 hypothetical protein PTSG_11824 [Salpingoeca rosetta]